MIPSREQQALRDTGCEVAFDNLARELYATDASLYRVEPSGVAFPRGAAQASAVIERAAELGFPITPRGAGTGLVGGAIGEGLVIDFARHNQEIGPLDFEQRIVRVGAGVVLDQLNAFLKPHGLAFGPDVATSSRATLGGMIANNSSGARTPLYGTTADHVVSIALVMADGHVASARPGTDPLNGKTRSLAAAIQRHSGVIRERMPPGLLKRWPGYGLDRFLANPDNPAHLLAGSEGTLAGILSAEVRLVPLPREKGLGLIFFDAVAEAMQATVALLDLRPAAIEHIDHVLLDQTRGQRQFQAARDLLELEAKPCKSLLVVEFYEDVAERLAILEQRNLGRRTLAVRDTGGMNLVWGLRKAGLSLLTSRPGPAKPVTCVEDTAVRPEQLPDYVRGLESIMKPLSVEACYYGHAASGLLHVRPVLDLHRASDLGKLRAISDEVSALVRQFKGSLAAEHGVGMARTEYMRDQLGPELVDLMRQVKIAFDPRNAFNPGKILDDGRFKIDQQLRWQPESALQLGFKPVLGFVHKDRSFVGNLEQCNGCGGCRKSTPTMCPTFAATSDEIMSTRGRANIIRAALEGRFGTDPLASNELDQVLSQCLGCKACATECPSNVDLGLLKADLLHAQHKARALPLKARIFSHVDLLGRAGCAMPLLANLLLESRLTRRLLKGVLGLAQDRPLPRYALERFDRWFERRPRGAKGLRGEVVLWDDTFVRHHEPHIGRAAVQVLEAAGFEVVLARGRQCCGRPSFSQGALDRASRLGTHNLTLLQTMEAKRASAVTQPRPILFLEPSCYSMFVEDYRELQLAGAADVASRCFLFEEFIDALLRREPQALHFKGALPRVAVHAHCHVKALVKPGFMARLAHRAGAHTAAVLETGCCGMAGAYGSLGSNAAVSQQIAAPLLEQIHSQPPGTIIAASGTSCRQQIEHLGAVHPLHMAEVLASALG